LKEDAIIFFNIWALLRGPILWPSRAANWRPLI